MWRVAIAAGLLALLLAACWPFRIIIEPAKSPPLFPDAGNPGELADTTPTTEPDGEPPMANQFYTKGLADVISGAIDPSAGVKVYVLGTQEATGIATFPVFDASDTLVTQVAGDVGYRITTNTIPALVYSDPGLDGGDMIGGVAGWDTSYFPFNGDGGWITALLVYHGTTPIAWIDVTSTQCGKAPLPIHDVAGNFLSIYWNSQGIFDEDTGVVYAPQVCTNEPVRASAVDIDLTAPGGDLRLVGP